MLAELPESAAEGEIAAIFAEIRHLWAVPYVSSVYRHMATRPGLLEWAWSTVAPVFRDGRAQDAAWTAARSLALAPAPVVPRAALRVWGIDAKAEATIAEICDGFTRVSPVNLVFAGLMRRLLAGEQPGAKQSWMQPWTPPTAVPAPPAMVDVVSRPPAEQEILMVFAKGVGATPFVPGLYRMLAHWPNLMAHLAAVLGPRIDAPETRVAYDAIRADLDRIAGDCLACLPPVPSPAAGPSASERAHILTVLDTYRRTSPEMIAFGRLIREALPGRA